MSVMVENTTLIQRVNQVSTFIQCFCRTFSQLWFTHILLSGKAFIWAVFSSFWLSAPHFWSVALSPAVALRLALPPHNKKVLGSNPRTGASHVHPCVCMDSLVSSLITKQHYNTEFPQSWHTHPNDMVSVKVLSLPGHLSPKLSKKQKKLPHLHPSIPNWMIKNVAVMLIVVPYKGNLIEVSQIWGSERVFDTRHSLTVSVFLASLCSFMTSWAVPHDLVAHVSRNCVFTWKVGVCVCVWAGSWGGFAGLSITHILTLSSLVNNPVRAVEPLPPPGTLTHRVLLQ